MYKAVNVNKATYDELHKIAAQLGKPKAQVVEVLVAEYRKAKKQDEQAKLDKFNKEMRAKIKALKLSKKISFDPEKIDEYFEVLADTDYEI